MAMFQQTLLQLSKRQRAQFSWNSTTQQVARKVNIAKRLRQSGWNSSMQLIGSCASVNLFFRKSFQATNRNNRTFDLIWYSQVQKEECQKVCCHQPIYNS